MISIGKIVNGDRTRAGMRRAVDQAVRYHQDAERDLQVDLFTRKDVHAYYVLGESVGRWAGRGAAYLGLTGAVDPAVFRAVLEGRDPMTGLELGKRDPRSKAIAFDVAFSAPKSVSLLYATADDERVRKAVMDALHAGADAAMGYLEDRAGWARKNDDLLKRPVPVRADLVAARFLHRLARPVTDKATGEVTVDPQLHIHNIVSAMVRREDGGWSMLHSTSLYAHAAAAGAVGQAVMRDSLVRNLGVEVDAAPDGSFEVRAVTEEQRREFSRRARQIEEEERSLGLPTGPRTPGESRILGHKTAVLGSRETKDELAALGDLWGAIRTRAEAVGLDQAALTAMLDRDLERDAPRLMDAPADQLLGSEGLTGSAASFSRRHVVRAVAAHAPRGASRTDVEAMADRILADPTMALQLKPREVMAGDIPVSQAMARWRERGLETRWSTPEMIALEARMLQIAVERQEAGVGVARAHEVDAAIRRRDPDHGGPGLTDDQQRMVREVALSPRGVVVVDGAAGTGKTTAMEAIREALDASGVSVLAHALTGRAARQIREDSGIRSSTIASLLLDIEQFGGRFRKGGVVIVDEAGMVGSRDMARLVQVARRDDVKLVLSGDPKQVQPIDGGAAYRALGDALGRIELTEVVRQRSAPEWQRQALLAMREGRGQETLKAFIENGGVRSSETGWERKHQMVGDYFAARDQGWDVAMLALRIDEAEDLNSLARAVAVERGLVAGPELEAGGHRFQVGDQVMCTMNDVRRFGVVNGLRGTVTAIDTANRRLTFRTHKDEEVRLPIRQYPHLVPGYAMTIAKGQGMNADALLAMGSEGAAAENTYTSLSRHRMHVAYYVVERRRDPDLGGVHHQEPPQETVEERYLPAFTRWEDKDSTLDYDRVEQVGDPVAVAAGPASDGQRAYISRIGRGEELPPEATWLFASVEIDARHGRSLGKTATAYLLEQGAEPEDVAKTVQHAIGQVTGWRVAARQRAGGREHMVGAPARGRTVRHPGLNIEWRQQTQRDLDRQRRLDRDQTSGDRLHERERELRHQLNQALAEAAALEPRQPDPDAWARLVGERDRAEAAGAVTGRIDAGLRALENAQREHERWASARAPAVDRAERAHHELEDVVHELEELEGPAPTDIPEAPDLDLEGPDADEDDIWAVRLDDDLQRLPDGPEARR
jgi:conjugative relaxase-like TrwC/TraI family protein